MYHVHNICYMCSYFYNAVVCEAKVTKTLSIKCIIRFVNTLNKIHFYVWSVHGVLVYIDAFLNGTVITNIVPFIMSLSDL